MQSLVSVLRVQPFYVGEAPPTAQIPSLPQQIDIKGWDYVFNRLVEHGIERHYLANIFADSRMPERDTLYFSLSPREPHDIYRKRQNKTEVRNAMRFYHAHYDEFQEASQKYNVPASVILAILQVETRCGAYTGNERIFPQLVRLASAADPENIAANFEKKSSEDHSIRLEDVDQRAKWLEETFLPHAVATLVMASEEGLDPLDIRGSGAGAIGMAQFLPGNSYQFGADGDGNGKVDLFQAEDAIPSIANYLRGHGWVTHQLPRIDQRRVIADYNRSNPYINLVLFLKDRLDSETAKVRLPRRTRPTQPSV